MTVALAVYVGDNSDGDSFPNRLEATIHSAVEKCLPVQEIADTLGVPPGVPISYKVESGVAPIGNSGVIHVDFSVRRGRSLDRLIPTELAAEIGELVLERLDGLSVATADTEEASHVAIRLHVTEAEPPTISSADLAERAGFSPSRILGWSKGCHSWPW